MFLRTACCLSPRVAIWLIGILLTFAFCLFIVGAQDRDLELETPVENEIVGGQSHYYRIHLDAHEYLRVRLDQKGVDAAMSLFAPDGKKLAFVDTPNTTQGAKYLFAIAETSGIHRLEIRSQREDAPAARYEIRIAELRVATKDDETRIAIRDLTAEGAALRLRATAASIRQAIPKLEEAIKLSRSISDRPQEAEALANLGAAFFSLSRLQETVETFRLAMAIWQELSDLRNQAVSLSYIAACHQKLGEWQKVLDNQNQALLIYQSLGDLSAEATQLNNLGTFYAEMGDRRKAIEFFNRALPLSQRAGDRRLEIITLYNLGTSYRRLADYRTAITYFKRVIALSRAVEDAHSEALALSGSGFVLSSMERYEAALDDYKRSLQLSRSMGDKRNEFTGLLNVGITLYSMGDKSEALDYLDQALRLSREVRDPRQEIRILYNLAAIYTDFGNLPQVRSHIEAALALVESQRARIPNPDLRAQYFATVKNCYNLYINLLMKTTGEERAKAVTEAFRMSERSRARSLLETLMETRIDIRQGVGDELIERERLLQRLMSGLAERRLRLLRDGLVGERAEAVAREISDLTIRYQAVQAEIRSSSLQYAALVQTEPLTLEEIQRQVLDEDTVLLEYVLGPARSHLWAVTTDTISSYELPSRDDIEASARRYYKLILANGRPEEMASAAAELSRMALTPAAAHLGRKRIVIVADGVLQYIPFASLPAPQASVVKGPSSVANRQQRATGKGQRTAQPLIAEHEIVSLPSASTLAVLRLMTANRTRPAKAVAVLADPVFSAEDVRIKRSRGKSAKKAEAEADSYEEGIEENRLTRALQETGLAGGRSLPRLLGTRREARSILGLVPEGRSLEALDFKASQATVVTEELGNYRIVHFATHGIINSQSPDLSGIVLSLVDEDGRPREGFLQLHEIYDLKLPVDLVVLSACQTALGRNIRGEGLIGLTRGFMYAGAPRVVASLWKVDDEATGELMKHFYRGMLSEGLRPAAALRAAQKELLKQKRWRSPYYWAAFVLQGEWR